MKELRCLICGNIINPHSKRKRYCSAKCAQIGNAQNAEKHRNIEKEKRAEEAAKRTRPKKSGLDKAIKEIVKYNQKNGTSISYGMYARMVGL